MLNGSPVSINQSKVDVYKASEYLDMLEEFTHSKQTKTFKRAYSTINNKFVALRKRHPNSLEYDFLRDAIKDIRKFWDYTFDVMFNAITYANDLELKFSHMLGESQKYAKILACLGVTPMTYFILSDETLDFVIDNYAQIGMLTIEQLIDIDIAYMICKLAFNKPPKDYEHLKKTYNFIKKRHQNDTYSTEYKSRFRKGVDSIARKPQKRRRKRH